MEQIIIYFTNKKKQLVQFLEVYEKMVHNIKIRVQLEVDRQFDSIQQLFNQRKIDEVVLQEHLIQNQNQKRILMEDITKQINEEIFSWINNKTINPKYQSFSNQSSKQLDQRRSFPIQQYPTPMANSRKSMYTDMKAIHRSQINQPLAPSRNSNILQRANSLSKFSIVQQKNSGNKKITITKNHQVCQSLDHKIRNEAFQILKRTESASKRGRSPMKKSYEQPNSKKKQFMDSISQFIPSSNTKPFMSLINN